ncbi:hypothetical protein B0H12DRAFT_1151289 [Mycena haematopus]|nr:hypothetical protein B0H12DRAFT_1151289 [Mycena haematopus]
MQCHSLVAVVNTSTLNLHVAPLISAIASLWAPLTFRSCLPSTCLHSPFKSLAQS